MILALSGSLFWVGGGVRRKITDPPGKWQSTTTIIFLGISELLVVGGVVIYVLQVSAVVVAISAVYIPTNPLVRGTIMTQTKNSR